MSGLQIMGFASTLGIAAAVALSAVFPSAAQATTKPKGNGYISFETQVLGNVDWINYKCRRGLDSRVPVDMVGRNVNNGCSTTVHLHPFPPRSGYLCLDPHTPSGPYQQTYRTFRITNQADCPGA